MRARAPSLALRQEITDSILDVRRGTPRLAVCDPNLNAVCCGG
jgi:hypothetical protein